MISRNGQTTQFSEVALKMQPWTEPATSLGFYATNTLATNVADFVRNTFIGEFRGGIDVSVQERSTTKDLQQFGEKTGFLDVRPGRMGAIYTICTALDREEVIRIVGYISTLKEKNEQSLPFSPSKAVDQPTSLQQNDCYVLYERPITNKKPLGIYASQNALLSVIKFLSLVNINYEYRLEKRHVVVFASGSTAAFTENKIQEEIKDQNLMRVAVKLDLFEVKRIIQSLDNKESI